MNKINIHRPLNGLNNLANTCYMNSTLQTLISITNLSDFFISNQYLNELD